MGKKALHFVAGYPDDYFHSDLYDPVIGAISSLLSVLSSTLNPFVSLPSSLPAAREEEVCRCTSPSGTAAASATTA